MSCLCFNNCLFRRKDDTKLLMQTNIQDIKQKQRSVFKAPRSLSKNKKTQLILVVLLKRPPPQNGKINFGVYSEEVKNVLLRTTSITQMQQ